MQASIFILGLIASLTSAIPTPETQSTCLNVREPEPKQPFTRQHLQRK
jgi:hypothetical protein